MAEAIAGVIKIRFGKRIRYFNVSSKRLAKETTLAGLMLTARTAKTLNAIAGELIDTFETLNMFKQITLETLDSYDKILRAASKDITCLKIINGYIRVSVDQSEQIIKNVGKLAQAEGVAAGKVIRDIAANTEKLSLQSKRM